MLWSLALGGAAQAPAGTATTPGRPDAPAVQDENTTTPALPRTSTMPSAAATANAPATHAPTGAVKPHYFNSIEQAREQLRQAFVAQDDYSVLSLSQKIREQYPEDHTAQFYERVSAMRIADHKRSGKGKGNQPYRRLEIDRPTFDKDGRANFKRNETNIQGNPTAAPAAAKATPGVPVQPAKPASLASPAPVPARSTLAVPPVPPFMPAPEPPLVNFMTSLGAPALPVYQYYTVFSIIGVALAALLTVLIMRGNRKRSEAEDEDETGNRTDKVFKKSPPAAKATKTPVIAGGAHMLEPLDEKDELLTDDELEAELRQAGGASGIYVAGVMEEDNFAETPTDPLAFAFEPLTPEPARPESATSAPAAILNPAPTPVPPVAPPPPPPLAFDLTASPALTLKTAPSESAPLDLSFLDELETVLEQNKQAEQDANGLRVSQEPIRDSLPGFSLEDAPNASISLGGTPIIPLLDDDPDTEPPTASSFRFMADDVISFASDSSSGANATAIDPPTVKLESIEVATPTAEAAPQTQTSPELPPNNSLDETKSSWGIESNAEETPVPPQPLFTDIGVQTFRADETVTLDLEQNSSDETIDSLPMTAESEAEPAASTADQHTIILNDTGDDLFEREYHQGLDDFSEQNWGGAVHHLSIAAALRPDVTDVKEKLREARRKRKNHYGNLG